MFHRVCQVAAPVGHQTTRFGRVRHGGADYAVGEVCMLSLTASCYVCGYLANETVANLINSFIIYLNAENVCNKNFIRGRQSEMAESVVYIF